MSTSNTLDIIIKLKDLASQNMQKIETGIKGLGAVSGSIADKVFNLNNALIGLGAGAAAKGILDTSASFERMEAALKTMTGSSAGAEKAMAWITDFTAKTPYELGEVSAAFTKLSAYGLDATKDLQALGDTAASMGKPLNDAVEAMADAVTGEFERLKEFGIRTKTVGDDVTFSWIQNGEQMQKTVAKTGKSIEEGLLGILEGRFAGSMAAFSKTWDGMWSNMKDSFTIFQREIGDAWAFDALKAQLDSVLQKIQQWKQDGTLKEWAVRISEVITNTIENFKRLGAVLIDIAATFAPLLKALVEFSPQIIAAGVGIGATAKAAQILIGGFLLLKNTITAVAGAAGMLGTAFTAMGITGHAASIAAMVRNLWGANVAMGTLAATTRTLGTALTGIGVGVGIGMLLNQIPQVQTATQMLIAKIDELYNRWQLATLEIGRAWSTMVLGMTDTTAIDKQIESHRAEIAAIHEVMATIQAEKEARTAVATAVVEQAVQTAEVRKTAEQQVTEVMRAELAAQVEMLGTAKADMGKVLDELYADINIREADGVITHQEAEAQKTAVTIEAYEQRLAALTSYAEEAVKLEGADSEKAKLLTQEKLKIEREYASERLAIAAKMQQDLDALQDAELDVAEANYRRDLANYEYWAEKKWITEKTYLQLRRDAESRYYAEKLKLAEQNLAQAEQLYGADSAEFKKALAEKIDAETNLQKVLRETYELLTENTGAIIDQENVVTALGTSIQGIADANYAVAKSQNALKNAAMDATKSSSKASTSGSWEGIKISTGFNFNDKTWAQILDAGYGDLAKRTGWAESFANLSSLVKKFGGDASAAAKMAYTDLKEYTDELRRASVSKSTVKFTGIGSTEMPLSEKLQELGGKVSNFFGSIPEKVNSQLNLTGISSGLAVGLSGSSAGSGGAGHSIFQGLAVKDYGKTEIVVGGKGYPVVGQTNVIQQLRAALTSELSLGVR